MKTKKLGLLFGIMIVAVSVSFLVGFDFGVATQRSKFRASAYRIVETNNGLLVVGGKLHGWEIADFLNANRVNDLILDKFGTAYNTNPDSFKIGSYTTIYGYVERGEEMYEPTVVFLAPPKDYKGCKTAEECTEAFKKEIIVTTMKVPRLDFCPLPPITYSEAENKLFDQTAQETASALIEYSKNPR